MKRTRAALLSALMTAIVFVAGQSLAGIPNVELVTFLVFVAGYLLGPVGGAVVGAAGMGAHSLFNVMGVVVPPVWLAQVFCYALVGVAGAVAGPRLARVEAAPLAAILAALTGTVLVLFYQIAVNAVAYLTFATGVSLRVYVFGGIAFAAVHIVWNAALFLAAVPPTLRVLSRQRRELAAMP